MLSRVLRIYNSVGCMFIVMYGYRYNVTERKAFEFYVSLVSAAH